MSIFDNKWAATGAATVLGVGFIALGTIAASATGLLPAQPGETPAVTLIPAVDSTSTVDDDVLTDEINDDGVDDASEDVNDESDDADSDSEDVNDENDDSDSEDADDQGEDTDDVDDESDDSSDDSDDSAEDSGSDDSGSDD